MTLWMVIDVCELVLVLESGYFREVLYLDEWVMKSAVASIKLFAG
jgi:hypothetical protein